MIVMFFVLVRLWVMVFVKGLWYVFGGVWLGVMFEILFNVLRLYLVRVGLFFGMVLVLW